MHPFFLICAVFATVSALPVTVGQDGQVHLDRFAQLVATHWHFEHLDTIISKSYHDIAAEFERHIDIRLEQRRPEDRTHGQSNGMSSSDSSAGASFDLEVLRAQMLNAIQSHAEESLPMVWDTLADTLSRGSLEARVRDAVLGKCHRYNPYVNQQHTKDDEGNDGIGSEKNLVDDIDEYDVALNDLSSDMISYTCLQNNAQQLSNDVDQYVTTHLKHVFQRLDNEVLPDMLLDISHALEQVLDYFNQAILTNTSSNLKLQVKAWQPEQLQLRRRPLLHSTFQLNDNHPIEFFSSYASMAKIFH